MIGHYELDKIILLYHYINNSFYKISYVNYNFNQLIVNYFDKVIHDNKD